MRDYSDKPHTRRGFLKLGTLAAAAAGGMRILRGQQAPQAPQSYPDVVEEPVTLRSEDGRNFGGIFYKKRGTNPKVAIISSHPVGDNSRDWKCAALAQRGIGAFGLRHRYSGNEEMHIHEEILLDLAATVSYLKEQKGIPKVVMVGHSGGGASFRPCINHRQPQTRPAAFAIHRPVIHLI